MCSVITTPMAVVIFPSWERFPREPCPPGGVEQIAHSPLVPMQTPETVERRRLVTLGQGGVVENRLDKVVDGASQGHDRLADVHQFAGSFADDVYAQNLARVAVEDEFQPARRVAANLPARDLAIIRHAYLVRHILIGQLLLGFADEADL